MSRVNRRLAEFSRDKKGLREQILAEANGSTALIEFLEHCLEEDVSNNIFSDTDGFVRGVHDGKAKQALDVLKLLRSLCYDK